MTTEPFLELSDSLQAAGNALAIRFKEGLQRAKSDDQTPPSDSPLTKGGDRGVMERTYITCDDVLKNLRVKGYKV